MSRQVVVIGGGVIGLSAAYACAQRGLQVTVIDRQSANHEGCSYGNAGMIVPSHFVPLAAPGMVALGLKWMWHPESPFYIQPRLSPELLGWSWRFWRASTRERVQRAAPLLRDLHLASRELYRELAAQWSNEFGLVDRGLLMLCRTQQTLDEEAHAAEQARELGIPAEVHDAQGVTTLDPGVRMDVRGAIFFPRDCHLTPRLLMAGYQRRLAEQGVQFHWNTEVIGFERQGRSLTRVRTKQGDFPADEVVIAGGSWSQELVRQLGLRIPMQAGKGYSVTLEQPRQLPQICSILTEARVAVTPMGGSLRFGGTMELSGLNETIRPARVRGIVRAATEYFPEFQLSDFENLQPWCGLRPCAPDGLPYLGRPQRYENVVIATGHAMMGLSLAPITGQIVSQLIHREPVVSSQGTLDLKLLSPDRYA